MGKEEPTPAILRMIPHVDFMYAVRFRVKCSVELPEIIENEVCEGILSEIKKNGIWKDQFINWTRVYEIIKLLVSACIRDVIVKRPSDKELITLLGFYNEAYRYYKSYCNQEKYKDVRKLVTYIQFETLCRKFSKKYAVGATVRVPLADLFTDQEITDISESIADELCAKYQIDIKNQAAFGKEPAIDKICQFMWNYAHEKHKTVRCTIVERHDSNGVPDVEVALGSVRAASSFTVSNVNDPKWIPDIVQANAMIAILRKRVDILAALCGYQPIEKIDNEEIKKHLIEVFTEHYNELEGITKKGGKKRVKKEKRIRSNTN